MRVWRAQSLKLDRRQLLGAGVLGAAAAITTLDDHGHRAAASRHEGGGGHAHGHGGGANGATMRKGRTVDHAANGFNPTEILRDFDWGKTRRLPNGRVLREWEIVAVDKEIEIAPGITYPAWTFNGRVPGRRCAPARASCCASASSTDRRTRTRCTSTGSTSPRWTASRRSAPA
jgi:hypothetical protein